MLGKQEMKIKISRGFSCSPSHCIRIEIVVQSSHSGALWDTARRPMPSICGHTSPNPICLPIWVNKLDMEIERILGVRLQAGLRAWTQVLEQADDKTEVDMDTDVPQVSHKPGGEPKIKRPRPLQVEQTKSRLLCTLSGDQPLIDNRPDTGRSRPLNASGKLSA
ncbi:uncharacterized protein LOC115649779 isoform X1 [Gopherus evgoodei]|uniref:uncharacterized protein LOC115649779 isoform X1 n=1 Tax=Gopherus evgoodei TaxID=1825980 RepID=UPI0011CF11B9|nr:uncharacterized protein LOC115649779 isoform X1 [Gopherus evgoodei]